MKSLSSKSVAVVKAVVGKKAARVLEVHRFGWRTWVALAIGAAVIAFFGTELLHHALVVLEVERLAEVIASDTKD